MTILWFNWVLYYNKEKANNAHRNALMTTQTTPANHLHRSPYMRAVYFVLGFVFVGLGVLGTMVPGLPTTVFILLAGGCWAKSSERFYLWLYHHRLFGKMLRDWEERHAMPRFAKYLAWGMMTLSCAFLWWGLPPAKLWLAPFVSAICVLSAVWMYQLPDA